MQLEPKPLFKERMIKLLGSEQEFENWFQINKKKAINSIRCNTLKISPDKLKKQLESKPWKINQPFSAYPEIMIIENELLPGELGNSIEHLSGFYYVQEISSMLSALALNPKPGEIILDLCASPGSKTTQIADKMENSGALIANDKDLERIKILSANLQRMGVSNTIVTRHDGVILCEKLKKLNFKFDKILVDAPCSGEGTIRSSPKTYLMWNIKMIKKLSRMQKKLAESAFELLKNGGELVYSTCTHAPEENEAVINHLINKFNAKVEKIELPLKCRNGITNWEGEKFNEQVKLSCRIYPQDNDTEGFFLAKLKMGEKSKYSEI